MTTWSTAVDKAIAAYRGKKYVYFYGAKNIVLTNEVMDYLISVEKNYFSRYSTEEIKQIKKNSFGKLGIDCSGFTGWICTGDERYSVGQIENCKKYNSIKDGPTGSLLFTTFGGTGKHIGLDIGNGYCLQAGYESTDKNIKEGKAGIFLSKITETAWERSGESNVVDYTGAHSPYEPTTKLVEEVFGKQDTYDGYRIWVGECYGMSKVPIYSKASSKSARCGWPTLATGNLFDVIGEDGSWYKIRIAAKYIGFIEKRYVLRKTPQFRGTVSTPLYVRKNAGTLYAKVAVLNEAQVVDVCDMKKALNGAEWYYIKFSGKYGFCAAKYVKRLV